MRELPAAIVSPVGHPRALAVMRSLAGMGVHVVAADGMANPKGFFSNAAAEKVRIEGSPDSAIELALERARGGPTVLFATNDLLLIAAARRHDELTQAGLLLNCPPWPVLERFMRRESFYALATDLGIRTPLFHMVREPEDLERLLPELDFGEHDWVFKTEVWDVHADPRTRRHTRVLRGPADVRDVMAEVAPKAVHPTLVERVVPGTASDCIGVTLVVGPDHEPVVSYAVRRLQLQLYDSGGRFEHPYELGANAYCESVHDEEAVDAAVRLVRAGGYVGTVTVEFRRDAGDGALTLIKSDPRLVRATALSTVLGLDVPRAQYELLVGDKPPARTEYRAGVGWMWISHVMLMRRQARRRSARTRGLGAWLRGLLRVRAFGYLTLRDPLPFLRDISQFLPKQLGRRVRKRITRRSYSSVPLQDARPAPPPGNP